MDFAAFLSEIIIQRQIHLLENGRAGKNEKFLIIIAALFLLTIPCNSYAAGPEETYKKFIESLISGDMAGVSGCFCEKVGLQ